MLSITSNKYKREPNYVLLNKKFFNDIPSELADANIKLVHWYQLILILIKNRKNSKLFFTPTPHPIPFVRNQCIIFHDLFPFNGLKRVGILSLFYCKLCS